MGPEFRSVCVFVKNTAESHVCVVTEREICWPAPELIGRQEDTMKNRFSKLENSWEDNGHKSRKYDVKGNISSDDSSSHQCGDACDMTTLALTPWALQPHADKTMSLMSHLCSLSDFHFIYCHMCSEMHVNLLQELLTRRHESPFDLTARDAGKCTLDYTSLPHESWKVKPKRLDRPQVMNPDLHVMKRDARQTKVKSHVKYIFPKMVCHFRLYYHADGISLINNWCNRSLFKYVLS